jgi:hypothetical protein
MTYVPEVSGNLRSNRGTPRTLTAVQHLYSSSIITSGQVSSSVRTLTYICLVIC